MPNLERQSLEEPEYVYWLGKVSSGLVPEEGKRKLIILDEIGSAAPENLIILHEILDAIESGQPVDLTEWGNGLVTVNQDRVRFLALTNPPGKGYLGKAPLDPALLRRFVYYKAPSELPRKAFSSSTRNLFHLTTETSDINIPHFLQSREYALLPEQLDEIPEIEDVLKKYEEFHYAAKEMIANRKLAPDQPQPFTFGDRSEPRRVRDFVLAFYNGDINETFQEALRYYYANKLESQTDRDKLEELIRHVEYMPSDQSTSQRRGLKRGETQPEPVAEDLSDVQNQLRRVLGSEVAVKRLPEGITPEVLANMERLCLGLRYIPELGLDRRTLEEKGVDAFLKEVVKKYPNWRPYENLSEAERSDHSIPRNLERWYWEQVKEGNVDFPELPGYWIAVELMEKPNYRGRYADSPITEAMGLKDRFDVSWDDSSKAIKKIEADLLKEIGYKGKARVRKPTTIEENLLMNMEGWGKTDTYEWTEDELRAHGEPDRLLVGDSDLGGAAGVHWDHPEYSYGDVGFRLAVVFEP